MLANYPSNAYKMKVVADWSWEDLRDYVVTNILDTSGPYIRGMREKSIFQSFFNRYDGDAIRIAFCVFETFGGEWHGRPVDINCFCKGSDHLFGDEILEVLERAEV